MDDRMSVGRPVPWDSAIAQRDYAVRRTLLYIEDSTATVQVITAMLQRRPSIAVLTARTGEQGIELTRKASPDLVLLDLDLPDMGGDQVLRTLLSNRHTRHIPVVILSADATARQFDRLLRLGARAYLTKPVPMRALLGTVDMHIEPLSAEVPQARPVDAAVPEE